MNEEDKRAVDRIGCTSTIVASIFTACFIVASIIYRPDARFADAAVGVFALLFIITAVIMWRRP